MNLRFLVFSTLDKRRRACEAEVQLNARLAPDVYLGVRPISQDAAGALTLEGSGEVVEWAVAMKRLPDVRRAGLLLRRGELRDADVDALAARLASSMQRRPRTKRCRRSAAAMRSGQRAGKLRSDRGERARVSESFSRAPSSCCAWVDPSLDASFRARKHRQRAVALAAQHGAPFWMVEASASPELCRAHLQERVRGPSVSDGRLEIFDDFVAGFEPMDELESSQHVVLDTGRGLSESERLLRAALPCWPPGLSR